MIFNEKRLVLYALDRFFIVFTYGRTANEITSLKTFNHGEKANKWIFLN